MTTIHNTEVPEFRVELLEPDNWLNSNEGTHETRAVLLEGRTVAHWVQCADDQYMLYDLAGRYLVQVGERDELAFASNEDWRRCLVLHHEFNLERITERLIHAGVLS